MIARVTNNVQVKKAIKGMAFVLTLLLTLLLSYYNFGNDGRGNPYYIAAIKSMTLNWHNFFFVSFDPGGFVSVDKPPVALWLQVIFVKVMGFHTWSIMLPEALAALASVAIVYHLVKKSFDFIAAITAAAVLACTPIFIAASRSNDADAILAFVLILSAWALIVAVERGSLKHLVLAAVFIGIGFNTKMLVAFLIVPVFIATYFLSNAQKFSTRIIHLAIAAVVLCVVSFSWIAVVDLTPATQRPYVGSSLKNSEFDLAFGYNGFKRIFLNTKTNDVAKAADITSGIQEENIITITEQDGSGNAKDSPGPFRMFNPFLAGQISWFIPLALLGGIGALFYIRTLEKLDKRQKYIALVLWGGWAVFMLVFFSFYRNLTHRYYLNIVAPGIAALAGIGFSCLLKLYTRRGFKAFLLPVALLLSAVLQIMILSNYPSWKTLLMPVLWVCMVAALVLTLMPFINKYFRPAFIQPLSIFLSIGCIAMLLLIPSFWSFTTVIGHVNGEDAHAGPELLGSVDLVAKLPDMQTILKDLKFNASDPITPPYYQELSEYLLQHQGSAKYIVAVPNATMAENIIIDTGKPVIAIGGFSGENPILTLTEFKNLIQSGKVKYFLNGSDINYGPNSKIITWVVSNSKMIDLHIYDIKAEYNTIHDSLFLMIAQ
jgi:4-amino-4-deoxy-L-arabinose transferase-like glycosyltransferase